MLLHKVFTVLWGQILQAGCVSVTYTHTTAFVIVIWGIKEIGARPGLDWSTCSGATMIQQASYVQRSVCWSGTFFRSGNLKNGWVVFEEKCIIANIFSVFSSVSDVELDRGCFHYACHWFDIKLPLSHQFVQYLAFLWFLANPNRGFTSKI